MVLRPTETGGEVRAIELAKSEPTVRTSAAIERWPIGPTGEARRTAFTVRSASTLPVHPGCEIRWALTRMQESLRTWVARSTGKSNPLRAIFLARLRTTHSWRPKFAHFADRYQAFEKQASRDNGADFYA